MAVVKLSLPNASAKLVTNRERLRVLAALDGTIEVSARDLQNLILAGEGLQRTVDQVTAPAPQAPRWRLVAGWFLEALRAVLYTFGALHLLAYLAGAL